MNKGHAYSTINNEKCAIAIVVYIPPYDSLNELPLINKYMTGTIFVWDVDILLRYNFEQQEDNCLLSEIILTQKFIVLLLLLGFRDSVQLNYLVLII